MEEVPESLRWMQREPAARAWLASVPTRLRRAAARWELEPGPPFPGSHVSWTCPATRADGGQVVLKLQFPHDECRHEAAALLAWDGHGAVRLLDHAPELDALLLERCLPGDPLRQAPPAEALGVMTDLLARLAIPAGEPFSSLEDEAGEWALHLPGAWEQAGRPFERRLLDSALLAFHELPGTGGPPVLLHQDLHADNVLGHREGWLAIDPKPLAGERAFAPAPVIRSYELGHSRAAVLGRLRHLSRALELDEDRVRRWCLAQTLAWCFEGSGVIERHVETARWLAG